MTAGLEHVDERPKSRATWITLTAAALVIAVFVAGGVWIYDALSEPSVRSADELTSLVQGEYDVRVTCKQIASEDDHGSRLDTYTCRAPSTEEGWMISVLDKAGWSVEYTRRCDTCEWAPTDTDD